MKLKLYECYYKIEESYWWFVGMRRIFYRVIGGITRGAGFLRILDIGCGTGVTLKGLGRFGDCIGVDIEPKALRFCKKRGIEKLITAEGTCLPFKDGSFDLITSFSIIEHIDDDVAFVKELKRVCSDKGRIILSTSAFNFLWSRHDIVNEHRRRYTKQDLSRLIDRYFVIEKVTYTNFILFPFIWAGVKLDNLLRRKSCSSLDGFYPIPAFINNILIFILKIESVLLERVNFPFGVSLLCIAKKDR